MFKLPLRQSNISGAKNAVFKLTPDELLKITRGDIVTVK
ncbi:hypothetical protein DCCM_3529 [Desulfocucumis palustris]|uniref:Uncharacterized protein n=1 Tax=Desulfocucumis palustris TaxID=1898651 RepID=A0A2L2XDW4_9FIRM|nr:hypothetical protein DCCM_3529 [Desulfocucumis palustris]